MAIFRVPHFQGTGSTVSLTTAGLCNPRVVRLSRVRVQGTVRTRFSGDAHAGSGIQKKAKGKRVKRKQDLLNRLPGTFIRTLLTCMHIHAFRAVLVQHDLCPVCRR